MPFIPKHARFQGEWAEACFIAKAMSKGLRVSKPFGDSGPYDFITQFRSRLLRVQVKSIAKIPIHHYRVRAVRNSYPGLRRYSSREIDVLAAFLIPDDAWYIIPINAISSRSLYLYPHRKFPGSFEKFREAWHQLQ